MFPTFTLIGSLNLIFKELSDLSDQRRVRILQKLHLLVKCLSHRNGHRLLCTSLLFRRSRRSEGCELCRAFKLLSSVCKKIILQP